MTRWIENNAVAGILLAALLLATPVLGAEQGRGAVSQPADMSQFLRELGKKASSFTTLKTEFTQEKKMAMFKEKLVLKGRIYLQKPNRVAWHVDAPLRYSVLITDKVIRQWDEETNKVQEISLAKNPIFQNVLSQLTVWFSGEYGSLLDVNDVRVVKRDPLVMEFVPKSNNMSSKVIKAITITFREDQKYLQQIRIQELSGDVTTLRFLNTIMNAPLDSRSFEVKGRV
ncbi:MAG: outer membrane lipoprotein carrier protein LolA [Desulfuromonadales bacterium]|nr:outer membrane lipoprotein carrier protein LolA [Desulfuromonadales bacterium]